jgi:hypothetical protein
MLAKTHAAAVHAVDMRTIESKEVAICDILQMAVL